MSERTMQGDAEAQQAWIRSLKKKKDNVDHYTVKGVDGVIRSLAEHYDGEQDVEQDVYGAWLAIQNLSARVDELEAALEQTNEQ